jgi:hypothetical protein
VPRTVALCVTSRTIGISITIGITISVSIGVVPSNHTRRRRCVVAEQLHELRLDVAV